MRRAQRALLSVSDKTGLVSFARGLVELGVELISTGGTHKTLTEAGLTVTYISQVTGFPEILEGRVKTLHPAIHGGILARRDRQAHLEEAHRAGIGLIDLVVVNLYPFEETLRKPDVTWEEAIENIDIGGPSMVRSAAKNHSGVGVVVNPARYEAVLSELQANHGTLSETTRLALACEAFGHTARYDSLIYQYLHGELHRAGAAPRFPEELFLSFTKAQELRYGENPHQGAAFYAERHAGPTCLAGARQLSGKELSFNNINDADAALGLVGEFTAPAAVAVKHTTPCGVAVGATSAEAFARAYASDPVSIFGGIVAFNSEVDGRTAKALAEIFLEVILAPSFSAEALAILQAKKNLRLLVVPTGARRSSGLDLKRVEGGLLVQDFDRVDLPDEVKVVTSRQPSVAELKDLRFAWSVVKYVKSNAIVVASDLATLGIGGGQVNRIDPTRYALAQAAERARGAVLASDAFFPMPDVVEACSQAGISAIIQPGGAIRDQDSIDRANAAGIAMLFTGIRHFRH